MAIKNNGSPINLDGNSIKQKLLKQLLINANSLPNEWIKQLITLSELIKSKQD